MYLPKISVITPSYNQGEFIEETILSVISQGYSNLEYIIIDGGSNDKTVEIIKKYEDKLAYWVSEKDNGQTNAINKGISKASGEIICYLNSDDCFTPGALSKVAEEYLSNPVGNKIFVGDAIVGISIDDQANTIISSNCEDWDLETVAFGYGIAPQPSVFWTKGSLRFDESLFFCMDHAYWYTLVKNNYKPVRIDRNLSFYRIHPSAKGSIATRKMWEEHSFLTIKYLGDFTLPSQKLHLLKSFNYKIRNYFIEDIKSSKDIWDSKNILKLLVFQMFNLPGVLFNFQYIKFLVKSYFKRF